MKEQACRFTMCPEDAVLEAPAGALGSEGLVNLQCSLSVPIATTNPPEGGGHEHPSARFQGNGIRSGAAEDDHINSTPSAGNVPVHESVAECRVWRILPARIAISLRLERLRPSRPPRPSRAPLVAPVDSVCRLRLSILGVGELIRASHAGSLLPRHSLSESFTVMVGWNGNDQTVGSSLEWPVEVPSTRDIPAQSSGLSTDVLLDVPRDCRSGLVLTFRVLRSPRRTNLKPSKWDTETAAAAAPVTPASVSIDWDGLACLPVSATDYFVQTLLVTKPIVQPATADFELLTDTLSYSSSAAADVSAHGGGVFGRKPAPGTAQLPAPDKKRSNPHSVGSCRRTIGLFVRVRLQLETSPVSAPHVLSLSPLAARGPTEISGPDSHHSSSSRMTAEQCGNRGLSAGDVSLGNFRDPCNRHRVPYLRFSWPWDDYWLALTERRSSLVPGKPWRMGSRRAITWARTATATAKQKANDANVVSEGEVSGRLPLQLSGLDGSVAWPGWQELRKANNEEGLSSSCIAGSSGVYRGRFYRPQQHYNAQPSVLFIEAYDMGPYAPAEQRAAMAVQRVWRRAIGANRSAQEWWKYYAMVDKHNAAVCVQAHYRGWRGRQRAQVVKLEATINGAAAAIIQRRLR